MVVRALGDAIGQHGYVLEGVSEGEGKRRERGRGGKEEERGGRREEREEGGKGRERGKREGEGGRGRRRGKREVVGWSYQLKQHVPPMEWGASKDSSRVPLGTRSHASFPSHSDV